MTGRHAYDKTGGVSKEEVNVFGHTEDLEDIEAYVGYIEKNISWLKDKKARAL